MDGPQGLGGNSDPIQKGALQGASPGRIELFGVSGQCGPDDGVDAPCLVVVPANEPVRQSRERPGRLGHLVGEIDPAVRGLPERSTEERPGPVGPEASGDDMDGSSRSQDERPGQLTSEQNLGLKTPCPVRAQFFIGSPDMHDELATAVRDDPLNDP
jgi:hypothetical protein